MPVKTPGLNASADALRSAAPYINLTFTGSELAGVARQAVSWTTTVNGVTRPTADKTFSIPAGKSVDGWSGYSAASAGIDYGGGDFTRVDFTYAGTLTLVATATGYKATAL